ncbi:hypothetical protein DPMN_014674 [Dreissena polymorpha]|uniref:Uncharacterized protein n=1 Tax=Dreissena polymorpha TaxID=45954 RepID=A0A9D4NB88_DREPO|nr:hypothetical protein DPMN_014674 [Dreissena polymorpha]
MSGRGKQQEGRGKLTQNCQKIRKKRNRDEAQSEHDVPESIHLLASDQTENNNKLKRNLAGRGFTYSMGRGTLPFKTQGRIKNFTISWDGHSDLRDEDLHPVIQLGMIKG